MIWTWLGKGNVKRETECLLIAAQNNGHKNCVKAPKNRKYWLCGERVEKEYMIGLEG